MNRAIRTTMAWASTLVLPLLLGPLSAQSEPGGQTSAPQLVDTVMRSVYFEPGGVEIPKKFIPVLRGNALTITTTTDWRYVMLAGHCDRAESASPAGCLDAQRVANVRQKLLEFGVDPAVLRTEVHGATEPAIQGDIEAAWRYNRRVDFSAWK